jgi:Transposase IS66 family
MGLDREATAARPCAREEPLEALAGAPDLRPRPDVEPTNNAAERGLRAAVIYRKLSLGSRSQGGERTIERLLSVDPDLPAAAALALRLSRRRAQRESTRRPHPRARLTTRVIGTKGAGTQEGQTAVVASQDDESGAFRRKLSGPLELEAP